MCSNLFSRCGMKIPGKAYLFFSFFTLILATALCCPVQADSTVRETARGEIQASAGFDSVAVNGELEGLAQSNYGSYGMYLKVLETGDEAGYQADRPFYAASCYKLFQVMYVYEGAAAGLIDLGRIIVYQGCDYQDGCGIIQNMPMGSAFTTRGLCEMAIVYSDNIAANMLRRTYGYTNYRDYATSIGCPVTGQYGPNQTTAREMCIILMRVLQLADTNPLGQEVVDFLEKSIYKTRIPAGRPEGTAVGNKTGDYQGYLNDAAFVFLDDLTYVVCVLSCGAPGDRIHVEASRLIYERLFHGYCGGGHCTAGTVQPSTQWYFAEGTTREGFETWLCLANPGAQEAHTAVRAMSQGGSVWDMEVSVPAFSRRSLNMNGILEPDLDIALCVASDHAITAERPVYFRYRDSWAGGHCVCGANQPAREWYFAEGTTREGFETWLCLANPGAEEAHAVIRALSDNGTALNHSLSIPAFSRQSLLMNDLVGPGRDIALCVTADIPILAERPMYFRYKDKWSGGHCCMGTDQASTDWYFAEGTTREGFETWLCLGNPGKGQADVEIEYLLNSGEAVNRSYRLSALSRSTLCLNEVIGSGLDISSHVRSNIPILAERSIYFKSASGGSGGHCVNGIPGAGREWCLAEGCSREGFEEFICVGNPNRSKVEVTVELMSEFGEVVTRSFDIGPSSRFTLRVGDAVERGHDISARVTSDLGIVVERPVYFLFSPMGVCR
jgi:beta-lactamase class A